MTVDLKQIKRPVVIGVCPSCAGQGQDLVGEDFVECRRCGSTGDLDEYRLRRAYDCGREDAQRDVLVYLKQLAEMAGMSIDAAERPPVSNYKQLRERIGG